MYPFERRLIPKYVCWSLKSSTGTAAPTKPDLSTAVGYSRAGLTGYCGNDAASNTTAQENRIKHRLRIYWGSIPQLKSVELV
jgi:hypothetical protein